MAIPIENGGNYKLCEFSDLNLEKAGLSSVDFHKTVFDRVNFQFAAFSDCSFHECRFVNCNCSVISIKHTQFRKVRFEQCKIVGVDWSKAGRKTFNASFSDCILDRSLFYELQCDKFVFAKCTLKDALFQNASLRHARFLECDMAQCQFLQTDLSFADFTTSINYFINASNNILRKTKFSLPEAQSLLNNFDIILE